MMTNTEWAKQQGLGQTLRYSVQVLGWETWREVSLTNDLSTADDIRVGLIATGFPWPIVVDLQAKESWE